MSSPSPDRQKVVDHTYQSSETSDHELLGHCSCTDSTLENNPPKIDSVHSHCLGKTNHHHNIISLAHVPTNTSHIHPPMNQSVHVHGHPSPKTNPKAKNISPSCTCHLQEDLDIVAEMEPQGRKFEAHDRIEVSNLPPALPPRPPPRPRLEGTLRMSQRSRISNSGTGAGIRKYVFWCCVCGGLASILGTLFLAVYFLLRSYTSTLGYFETIPTFVPATMLILTGFCVMSLARRKNRYSHLIKVCGVCCLVCALTCVLVTITTTVIHMNRLQTLRECVYTQKTRTCTCYSVLLENHPNADDGMSFVFDSTPDCEVIHGALYSCLRAMFGLSVSGILVCIFSCMLVYQLLSHEKKKMYWEQLELRCRSFYQQHTVGPTSTHSSIRGGPVASSTYCSCCEECRYPPLPIGPQVYPWDSHQVAERFWTPGRVGNFYSPNPGEDCPPNDSATRERAPSGWSWRRLPWNRGTSQNDSQRDNSLTYQVGASSADSQYGFSNRTGDNAVQSDGNAGSTGSYSFLDNRPPVGGVYVWGPPPPYSNPNSPARRQLQSSVRYHHIHHHLHGHETHCRVNNEEHEFRGSRRAKPINKDSHFETTTEADVQQQQQPNCDNGESTDSSSCLDRISHTLPARKIKKKTDNMASVKSTTNQPSTNRTHIQNVFTNTETPENSAQNSEVDNSRTKSECTQSCRFLPRLHGVENAAFQKQEASPVKPETSESEVYFADVSSCCNISLRNDGQDSLLYDLALETSQKPAKLSSLQKSEELCLKDANQILHNFQENISSFTTAEDEDYLAHRMENRQMSTRSRMPFPLPISPDEITNNCLLNKELSQNSLCSSAQSPLTEITDDALTPIDCCDENYFLEDDIKHRSTRRDHFLAPDAQYEMEEQDTFSSSNLTNTISGLNNFGPNYYAQNKGSYGPTFNASTTAANNGVPKNLNLSQQTGVSRRNIGSNISALIQNLGGNAAGLLYEEANIADEEEIMGQGCHSDGTMDSGWQSGSEKTEGKNTKENTEGLNV